MVAFVKVVAVIWFYYTHREFKQHIVGTQLRRLISIFVGLKWTINWP